MLSVVCRFVGSIAVSRVVFGSSLCRLFGLGCVFPVAIGCLVGYVLNYPMGGGPSPSEVVLCALWFLFLYWVHEMVVPLGRLVWWRVVYRKCVWGAVSSGVLLSCTVGMTVLLWCRHVSLFPCSLGSLVTSAGSSSIGKG